MPILHGGSAKRLDKSAMKRIVSETVRVIPLLATINKAVGAMAKKDDRRRLAATTASAILRRTPASLESCSYGGTMGNDFDKPRQKDVLRLPYS